MPTAECVLEEISPNAPAAYNEGTVNATISDVPAVIPGFDDAMTDFTSEGPARLTSDLKPDISAPGFNIAAAAVGTGNEAIELSGTSMAAPHVSGVATLLRQLHPSWTPAQIKGVADEPGQPRHEEQRPHHTGVGHGDGRRPGGRLRVRAGRSVASPGSLSFGFAPTPTTWSEVRSFASRTSRTGGTRTPSRPTTGTSTSIPQ